jgi:hypothetical protein
MAREARALAGHVRRPASGGRHRLSAAVHFTAVAKEMMRRYPDYGPPILLWLTRGPGFGTAGAKEVGVPAELLGG